MVFSYLRNLAHRLAGRSRRGRSAEARDFRRLPIKVCPSWSSWFGSCPSRLGPRNPLSIELLEGRCVPTTITPTAFADGGSGSGSLRDAVLQFNADTGTDDDTIQLQAGTYSLTIQNVGGRHETDAAVRQSDLIEVNLALYEVGGLAHFLHRRQQHPD